MSDKNNVVAIYNTLDGAVQLGKEAQALNGFEKAYKLAEAAKILEQSLTPAYMAPIMALQNKRLGFRTDKDGGYPEHVVKQCLIEAVLIGVQPVNNQFNIIGGNTYITKEGFDYLLNDKENMVWEIIPGLPRLSKDNPTSGAVKMTIRWKVGNKAQQEREIDFAVRINKHMGIDAVIGKATRKARAWLHATVAGYEIADGDADNTIDVTAEIIDDKVKSDIKADANSKTVDINGEVNDQSTPDKKAGENGENNQAPRQGRNF